jgi:CelD/BcsL family acetyltransferase involved in cellulose biosynthesis
VLALSLQPIEAGELGAWETSWRGLEQSSADPSVYTTYDWIRAWADTYSDRRLVLAHVSAAHGGDTVALALIEVDRIRGWRFAGGEVTPRRAPLTAAGHEAMLWHMLADWLQAHPRAWSTFDACEVPRCGEALPGARLEAQRTPCLALPASFEAYLAALPSKRRGELRRRLRLAEREHAHVREVPAERHGDAIADFVRLHRQRALAKREHHALVDERLTRLLTRISAAAGVELSIFELCHRDARVAIDVRLSHRGVIYPYNLGWEPSVARLAPGVLLALNAIADGIARGAHTVDLGPGEQRYKLELGFTSRARLRLHAVNPSAWGSTMRVTGEVYQRLRSAVAARKLAISR